MPEPEGADESSAEDEALQSIGRRSMLELIEDLSHEQQQVLTLKFVFNFSNGEAATILGKTEGAVKSLQHRALASLQKQVAARSYLSACARSRHRRPARAGKTSLFTALTQAGAPRTTARRTSAWRRSPTSGSAGSRTSCRRGKITPAAIRVRDVPGTGPALLGNLRQVDALLVVLDGFSDGATRRTISRDLKLELLVADRDHVERRLERVAKQAKSGDPTLRDEVDGARAAPRPRRRAATRSRTGRASCRPSSSR